MNRLAAALVALLALAASAHAAPCPPNGQPCINTIPTDGNGNVIVGATTGNAGSLTATTVSVTIASLITSNAGNAASWPTGAGNIPTGFYAQNFGGTDVAICLRGGTCTCAENGVANTNGTTVKAGSYFGFFGFGTIAYNVPTIVACSGSDRVEIDQ